MIKFNVVDTRNNKDITDMHRWVLTSDGELYYIYYGDLVGFPDAKVIFTVES